VRQRIDIYGLKLRLERAERRVEAGNPISARSAELIKRFGDHCFSEGLSEARVVKYLTLLRKVAEWLGKDLDEATREDIERLVNSWERSGYSAWTKHDYKVTLKKFYRWLRGGEDYPPEVRWIKTTFKSRDAILPEDILTEEEVMSLVRSASSVRDRAFIMALYESGARISELGSMRIGDVEFKEGYATLMLKGKTGPRRVIVVAATPYLQAWVDNHPLKDDPNAPLWVNMGTVNRHEAMSYPALAKVLKVAAERAGLRKRVTPHRLRHSRATFLARRLTEAQMNQFFGWRQGSEMPSIYVHLSGRDLDDAILGVYGFRRPEQGEAKLKPKVCPRCQALNQLDARFCIKCGLALDIKAAQEVEEARRRTDSVMDALMRDQEFREFLMRKLRELGAPSP
jgi:site-specific recombinase XerD/ribosomal protein L40E